jgi:protein-S-isoprenylcysteine O-methyltransferase Ste14
MEYNLTSGWHRLWIEYVYLLTLILCFSSFWYGSLKFFKQNVQTQQRHRILLRFGTIVVWNLSYLVVLFGSQHKPQLIAIGLMLNLLALVLFWVTMLYVKNRVFSVIFSQDGPTFLHLEGPYKYARHPFYTSYLLVYLGIVMSLSVWPLQLLCVFLIIYYVFAARQEEACFLKGPLAEQYLAYQSRTGMFLPRLNKFKAQKSGKKNEFRHE